MAIGSFFNKHLWLSLCLFSLIITLAIDEGIFSDQKRRVDPQAAITENLHRELDRLDEHVQDISATAIVSLDRLFSRLTTDEATPFFLFENGEVIYWSTNRFVPRYGTLTGTYLYKFLSLKSGEYVVKRKVINSAENRVIEIFTLLPLTSASAISDEFVENGMNARIFGRSTYSLSIDTATDRQVFSPEGIFLFSFEGSPLMKIDYPIYDGFILLLYVFVIFCFLKAGFHYAQDLAMRKDVFYGASLLAIFLIVFRFFSVYYEFPLSIIDWHIFDPFDYADGGWQPSIGDLLLNVFTLMALVLFIFVNSHRVVWKLKPQQLWLIGFFALVLTAHFVYQLESMITNGQWSFDVAEEISFSVSKVLGYFAVFISACMPVLMMHLLLLRAEFLTQKKSITLSLAISGVIALVVFGFTSISAISIFGLLCLYCALVLLFGLASQLSKLNYSSFLHLFLSSFIWSAIALVVLDETVVEELRLNKTALAIDLQSENDITAEYLLNQARLNIETDILIQNNISNPFSPKDLIEQKIRRVYLGDYFDKYEIEMILYNGNGKAINATAVDVDVLKEVYAIEENNTEFEHLYFLNDDFPQSLKQYYLFCEVKRYGALTGYVVLKLDRKRQLNNSILPRLLLDEESIPNLKNDLSYAFFKSGMIEEQNGTFNYRRNFNMQLLDDERAKLRGVLENGFSHTVFDLPEEDTHLVISSPVYPLAYKVTNFSIFFLFMIALIMTVFGLISLLINAKKQQTTISTKVQILLNFAFFLPLITVSIIVLQLVNETVEENLESKYLNTTRSAAENLVNPLYYFLQSREANGEMIENRIAEISQYAGADINLFNTKGQLIATNQRLIFDNELLAPFANPDAVASIIESSNIGELQLEQVGDIDYKATYYAIIGGDSRDLLGVLSMPFFDSQEELVDEQRQILSNILNAFTLIFVVFVILSFLASRVITYPFAYLTQKIRSTTLTKENEPLVWQADDEIGLLVREYNTMLLNLEKSKKALAQSEKESAWREMAQQVAHEIKNPLTPMKLKLQHLKRVLSEASSTEEAYEKPINNLLQQVDTLSDIATTFSAFAKMPIPVNERMDVSQVLKRTIGLFSAQDVLIERNIPIDKIWVMADEKLLGRIFNNLILNAIQSTKEDMQAKIHVDVEVLNKKVRISIADEGRGIPEDIKDKVFIPKFSTKREGSGIGLAIAKRGVEHAGGSIWFESFEGEGTTFFIEFPIID